MESIDRDHRKVVAMPDSLFDVLTDAIETHTAGTIGIFKAGAIDEPLAAARAAARAGMSDAQRDQLESDLERLRLWLIERDPEAVERLAEGRPAPKDIDTAVRVAEDYALGIIREDLPDAQRDLLKGRLLDMTVETLEERHAKAQPVISLRDPNFQVVLWGAIIVLGSVAATNALGVTALIGVVVGAVVFASGLKRWRSGATAGDAGTPGLLAGGRISKRQK